MHQPQEVIHQKYRILDTLGQGGVGITYLAQDLESGNNLALKVLSLRRMTDWKKIELFERESQILSQLNHPAIPRYLDYFKIETDNDNSFYIAQQLAPGKSLAELVENGYYFDESEVRYIAIQILDILIYLHSFSPPVIHRDIKPQNIIRGDNGKVFLVDFGAVADTYHNTVTGGSTVVGTFGYMAPEQFRGQAFPSTDLYSLGTTLLYLLTKKHPSDLPQKHLKIDFIFQIKVRLSPGFIRWLDNIIEPVAESRFSDAETASAILQGNESLDNYYIKKPQKPDNTLISLRKNNEKLQIDIPVKAFNHKINFILAMFVLLGNFLILMILQEALQYISFRNFKTTFLLMCAFFIYFIITFTVFKMYILPKLSRIKITLLRENSGYTFIFQKWLSFLLYLNYKRKLNKRNFFKRLKSIKYNLTTNEYRWLKAEIDNFVKK